MDGLSEASFFIFLRLENRVSKHPRPGNFRSSSDNNFLDLNDRSCVTSHRKIDVSKVHTIISDILSDNLSVSEASA